jgi:ATP diphosphatase
LSKIEELLAIMVKLRDPEGGCPWDQKQTLQSIVPHTIEEVYEVADAIENGDMAELKDELGDLLFQVVFYARIAEEQGDFDFEDVAGAISDKLIRRHPHVFTDAAAEDLPGWEALKEEERKGKDEHGVLDGVAKSLPANNRAVKLQKRAARVGFDWPNILPVFDKLHEELDEVRAELKVDAPHDRLEDEIGDVLFVCANLARHTKVDPETALRRANDKFERRFRAMEQIAQDEGLSVDSLDLDAWEALWQRVKASEKPAE